MNSNDSVKAQRIAQFWAAYKSCVEANKVQPQRSVFYVRWVQEFVYFQQDKKLRGRSAADILLFLRFLSILRCPTSLQPR